MINMKKRNRHKEKRKQRRTKGDKRTRDWFGKIFWLRKSIFQLGGGLLKVMSPSNFNKLWSVPKFNPVKLRNIAVKNISVHSEWEFNFSSEYFTIFSSQYWMLQGKQWRRQWHLEKHQAYTTLNWRLENRKNLTGIFRAFSTRPPSFSLQ